MRTIVLSLIGACLVTTAYAAGSSEVTKKCLVELHQKESPTMTKGMICYNRTLTAYWNGYHFPYMDIVQEQEDKNLNAGIAFDHHQLTIDQFQALLDQANQDFSAEMDRRFKADDAAADQQYEERADRLTREYDETVQGVAPIQITPPPSTPPSTSMEPCTQYGNTVNCMGTTH